MTRPPMTAKYIALLSLAFFPSCEPDVIRNPVEEKYCMTACMETQFGMFHSKGSSWGTGSSSMSGLSQEKIYDRVKTDCLEFYANEKCCQRPPEDYSNKVVKTTIHGYKFGACAEGPR